MAAEQGQEHAQHAALHKAGRPQGCVVVAAAAPQPVPLPHTADQYSEKDIERCSFTFNS